MPRWTFHTLAQADMSTLERVLRGGTAPPIEALVGWEYRGWNVLPFYGVPLFWAMQNLRFIKVFYHRPGDPDPADADFVRGVNFKVSRGGRHDPWTCTPSDARPSRVGYYTLYRPGSSSRASEYAHAAFFDYFDDRNNLFTGKYLEDFAVMPNPDDPTLLLGKAYLVLGPLRFGGFFVAERLQPLRMAIE